MAVSWVGHFQSEMYPCGVAQGSISFNAAQDILSVTPGAPIPVILTYLGSFRKGQSIDMQAHVTPDRIALVGDSGSGQVITLNIDAKCATQISGKYVSTGIADNGRFEIHILGTQPAVADFHSEKSVFCSVM